MSSVSHRSSRRAAALAKTRSTIPERRGIESLVKGNETCIQRMLSIRIEKNDNNSNDDDATTKLRQRLVSELESVMQVNNLSAEMMLGRFFDATVLGDYCKKVLFKSDKGGVATLAARIAREWGKPSFIATTNESSSEEHRSATNAGGKRKRDHQNESPRSRKVQAPTSEDEGNMNEQDWRAPLFFWKGKLDLEDEVLRFVGSWVSGPAESGVPTSKTYTDTQESNSFQLSCKKKQWKQISKEQSTNTGSSARLACVCGLSGNFKGSYLLDQGDGLGPRKFVDKSHTFTFSSQMDSSHTNDNNGTTKNNFVVVAALGSTEFGRFVSFGYTTMYDQQEQEEGGSGICLVLARRYIANNDVRNAWSPTQLINNWEANKTKLSPPISSERSNEFWSTMLPRCMRK